MENLKDYLTVEPIKDFGTRVTKVTKTKTGYNVQMFNNYITLYYLKIVINQNGTALIRWTVDKNYNPIDRFTTYYDTKGSNIFKAEYHTIK